VHDPRTTGPRAKSRFVISSRIAASPPRIAASSSCRLAPGVDSWSGPGSGVGDTTRKLERMLTSAPMIPTPVNMTNRAMRRPPAVTGYLSP
jgi:hypothetical protein